MTRLPAQRTTTVSPAAHEIGTAPTVTYGAGSVVTEVDRLPVQVRQAIESAGVGPVFTELAGSPTDQPRQDGTFDRQQTAWRLGRDGLVVVAFSLRVERRGGEVIERSSPQIRHQHYPLNAARGALREGWQPAPPERSQTAEGTGQGGGTLPPVANDIAWQILPEAPRRAIESQVPAHEVAWYDALTVLSAPSDGERHQEVWHVRWTSSAVAGVEASRPAGPDGSRRDHPWFVRSYIAPLATGELPTARRHQLTR